MSQKDLKVSQATENCQLSEVTMGLGGKENFQNQIPQGYPALTCFGIFFSNNSLLIAKKKIVIDLLIA